MKARTKVYLEAARRIAEDATGDVFYPQSTCRCVAAVSAKSASWLFLDHWPAVALYREYFDPGGDYAWWNGQNTSRNRECRVIALCLMAAMVEAGDA